MVLNQADNVRQKFLILRFCFDWFKNRQRFQLLFHLCRRNLFFLYGDDRDIQANGSSFSFVRGDSVDVTAMKFRISLDQIKSDTCTFLIAGRWKYLSGRCRRVRHIPSRNTSHESAGTLHFTDCLIYQQSTDVSAYWREYSQHPLYRCYRTKIRPEQPGFRTFRPPLLAGRKT